MFFVVSFGAREAGLSVCHFEVQGLGCPDRVSGNTSGHLAGGLASSVMGPDTWGVWSLRSWRVGQASVHPLGRGSVRFRDQKSGPFSRFHQPEPSVAGFFSKLSQFLPSCCGVIPWSEKWVFIRVRGKKSSSPFIPTTARASSCPSMDILLRRH